MFGGTLPSKAHCAFPSITLEGLINLQLLCDMVLMGQGFPFEGVQGYQYKNKIKEKLLYVVSVEKLVGLVK
jgi:hypothetical protein